MAAIEQPEIDDLGIRPVELDILGIEVVRISGDIGLGGEVAAGVSFDPKIYAARVAGPAARRGATAGSLEDCGEMASATCAPTRPLSRIAP